MLSALTSRRSFNVHQALRSLTGPDRRCLHSKTRRVPLRGSIDDARIQATQRKLLEDLLSQEQKISRKDFAIDEALSHSRKQPGYAPTLPSSKLHYDEVNELREAGSVPVEDHGESHEGSLPKRRTPYADAEVLKLRAAGKNLVEQDFRNLIPPGATIEGRSAADELLKVIPGRNTSTFEPVGDYFILFRHAASVYAYKEHVLRLHRIQQRHHPPSSEKKPFLPAPPMPEDIGLGRGYLQWKPDDLSREIQDESSLPHLSRMQLEHIPSKYARLQSFSLLPPSRHPDLKISKKPHSEAIQRLLDNGGYEQLLRYRPAVAGDKPPAGLVLMSIAEEWQPLLAEISEAILKDGQSRGLPWSVFPRSNKQGRWIHELNLRRTPKWRSDRQPEEDIEADEQDPREQWRQRNFRRWVISFENEPEAKRFVAEWHRRDMGPLLQNKPSPEKVVIINAEFVW